VVRRFVLGGGEVVEPGVQAGVVVPVDPHLQGVFDLREGFERAVPTDDLGLAQSDDRFGQGVPRMHRRLTPKSVIITATWLWAGLLPLFLQTTNPLLLGVIGAASAFLGPIWNVVIVAYFITQVPDRLRGRVASAAMTVTAGTIPLASAAAGYLLAATGTADSIIAVIPRVCAMAV